MDLPRRVPAEGEVGVQEVLDYLVLVALYDVSDALVPDCEEAAAVPHRGVAEGADHAQLSEVGQLLLDDVHPPAHISGHGARFVFIFYFLNVMVKCIVWC